MRIGYSFWGFLGAGIINTPDGGRSHRRTLIDGLIGLGHELVFLQPNRDLTEAGDDYTNVYSWSDGHPAIDALFLEWRWPIPERNDTPCGSHAHTCDLHRQADIVDYYTIERSVPTVIWDKDQQLPQDTPYSELPHVRICEPALFPKAGRTSLRFPVSDAALDTADPQRLAAASRHLPLVYVGNQYDRDDAFEEYFVPAASKLPHLVAGKWTQTARWPHVTFSGRVPYPEVERLHQTALATVLLAPRRYMATGQFTQRLFETVLAGCLPLAPAVIRGAETVVPPQLLVSSGAEVVERVERLKEIAGTPAHAHLIAECHTRLAPFRLSTQLSTLSAVLQELSARPSQESRQAVGSG